MDSIKISVIIPTARPQTYLDECLESLEKQTFGKDSYEVLIILNGEKEPYATDIQCKLSRYSFHSRFFYTSVSGVSNARNIGLDNVRGEYVCFIDDDDYVSANYLSGLYDVAVKTSPNAVVVSNVITFINKDDKSFGIDYIGRAFNQLSKEPTDSLFKKRKFLSSSCCKLIPMQIIGENRFDVNIRLGEDSLFMYMISNKIHSIKLSNFKTIYYIRLRSGSASRTHSNRIDSMFNKLYLINMYIKTYLYAPDMYSFKLLISRVVATMLNKSL